MENFSPHYTNKCLNPAVQECVAEGPEHSRSLLQQEGYIRRAHFLFFFPCTAEYISLASTLGLMKMDLGMGSPQIPWHWGSVAGNGCYCPQVGETDMDAANPMYFSPIQRLCTQAVQRDQDWVHCTVLAMRIIIQTTA